MRRLLAVTLLVGVLGCPSGASSPTVDADAAQVAVGAVCSLIEGIDDNGAIRNICATVEEIADVIAFVLTLRSATDAGAARSTTGQCETLPGSQFCATSSERAKGVLFLVRARSARLTLDGGR